MDPKGARKDKALDLNLAIIRVYETICHVTTQ